MKNEVPRICSCLVTSGLLVSIHDYAKQIYYDNTEKKPASRSSSDAFVFGAGGLRFKSRASQIGSCVANCSPPLQHFFESNCVAQLQKRGDGPRKLVTRFGVNSEYNEKFYLNIEKAKNADYLKMH